ncbi:MAG: undecaprenyl-diphosphatase [Bacillota bacterium]|nr:MAG: undecaprenyl-diphosphatase [Bacillota bacterium]
MEIWQAIVLGLVQGFTEFLPVSSSGHLVLLQNWFGIDPEHSMFLTIMLHVGTLIPVCIVFFKDILGLFKRPMGLLYLVIASVPAALVGFLLSDQLDAVFYGGKYLAPCFIITALVLLQAELSAKRKPLFKDINAGNALAMGVAQAIAVVPGISRSGSTIAAGCFCGVDRSKNANFAFLMSIPVILGSALLEGYRFIKAPAMDIEILPLLLGVLAAAVSGYIAIKVMLNLVKKADFKWFSLYLAILSLILLII